MAAEYLRLRVAPSRISVPKLHVVVSVVAVILALCSCANAHLKAGEPAPGSAPFHHDLPIPPATTAKTSAKPQDFWSFRPIADPALPAVSDAQWPKSGLDRFVLAKLETLGLHPVADANRRTFIRRLYFDLWGLPPSPEAIESFVQDTTPKALEKVVDGLLASPHFGERWGRHWLDVARYGESTGKERNHTYPEAWRYRNYVIDAFNAGVPYDRFIREQIAGDLLPAASPAERDRLAVATGFLALGPKSINTPRKEQFLWDLADEQIDATTRSILGLTVACARCHDHKFDPISQKDYYALAGIFRSTETHYGIGEEIQANRQPSDLIPLQASPLAEPSNARIADSGVSGRRLLRRPGKLASATLAKMRARRQRELDELSGHTNTMAEASQPIETNAIPVAAAMGTSEGRTADYPLLVRGELSNRGARVPRGFVQFLTDSTTPRIPRDQSGRLQLADWLTSKSNPLTARVMANRVWAQLFGQGLVRTADDFGAAGDLPSNPELLDYLASRLMTQGWSIKALIKEMVMSRAYGLSSDSEAAAYAVDPDNKFNWRASPRRLDAESIRDAMLAVSGQLDPQPLKGSVVAEVGDAFVGQGVRPERFNILTEKRSIYLPIVRDCVPDALDLFDFAEPSLVVANRDVTTGPAQALYLMNGQFVREQSRAFGRRLLALPVANDRERIVKAYELALARQPSASERDLCERYLDGGSGRLISISTSGLPSREKIWASFAQALLSSAEFRYLH